MGMHSVVNEAVEGRSWSKPVGLLADINSWPQFNPAFRTVATSASSKVRKYQELQRPAIFLRPAGTNCLNMTFFS
jgi:hypothetical protein